MDETTLSSPRTIRLKLTLANKTNTSLTNNNNKTNLATTTKTNSIGNQNPHFQQNPCDSNDDDDYNVQTANCDKSLENKSKSLIIENVVNNEFVSISDCDDEKSIIYLTVEQRDSLNRMQLYERRKSHYNNLPLNKSRTIVRKFQKLDPSQLTSTPAPDVKIGQRIAYKEYYGSEFGTIRWIGRVPQISPDWTVGVEFDNAIGEGDGSLNGRRYFIAKDCFAKFLPLSHVALVDQHVGRPEPGTMISVMSAAVRPGQMISIQRVSTVHVQHCFLNAPHRVPGAEFLAVNTRLHCQCPNCGPCAHVVKPPRTQRLRTGKNATHMCQFSTYTCCGMESQEEALCTYTGNRITSTPPPQQRPYNQSGGGGAATNSWQLPPPPIGNSWMEGSGYLTNLQAEQSKLIPDEYRLGLAAPEDFANFRRANHHHNHSGNVAALFEHKNDKHNNHHKKSPYNYCATNESVEQNSGEPNNLSNSQMYTNSKQRKEDQKIGKELSEQDNQIGSGGGGCVIANKQMQGNEIVSAGERVRLQTNNNEMLTAANLDNKIPRTTTQFSGNQIVEQHSGGGNSFGLVAGNGFGGEATAAAAALSARDVNQQIWPKTTIAAATAAANQKREQNVALENVRDEAFEVEPKPAKVVHRDSIENRYLFPTDDNVDGDDDDYAIDSTLEADLENLSQARYGQFAASGGGGYCNDSAASDGKVRHLYNSARNILKSLRFLISRLSAKSNHSDFDAHSRQYSQNNTMKMFESQTNDFTTTTNNYDNKSKPTTIQANYNIIQNDENYENLNCAFHSFNNSNSGKYHNNYSNLATANYQEVYHNYAGSGSGGCGAGYGFAATTKLSNLNSSKLELHQDYLQVIEANKLKRIQLAKLNNFMHDNDDELDNYKVNQKTSCNCNCGIDRESKERKIVLATNSQQQIELKRHISSSSDCGFSSASQNSSTTLPSCAEVRSSGQSRTIEQQCEQMHLNEIYRKIATKLISSTASLSNDELIKLKNALFEMHSSSCCLHISESLAQKTTTTLKHNNDIDNNNQQSINNSHTNDPVNNFDTSELDQLLADIIKRNYLSNDEQQNNLKKENNNDNLAKEMTGNELCNNNNDNDGEFLIDGQQQQQQQTQIDDNGKKINLIKNEQHNETSKETKISLDIDRSKETNSLGDKSLPQAFELKLTLSINNSDMEKSKHDNDHHMNMCVQQVLDC